MKEVSNKQDRAVHTNVSSWSLYGIETYFFFLFSLCGKHVWPLEFSNDAHGNAIIDGFICAINFDLRQWGNRYTKLFCYVYSYYTPAKCNKPFAVCSVIVRLLLNWFLKKKKRLLSGVKNFEFQKIIIFIYKNNNIATEK